MIIDKKVANTGAAQPKPGSTTLFVNLDDQLSLKTSTGEVANVALASDLNNRPTIVSDSNGNFVGLQNPTNSSVVSTVPTFTWLGKPLPSAYQGRAFISDIAGGHIFISNGTRWYPEGNHLTLDLMKTAVTNTGTTAETLFWRTAIRAGLLQNGDKLRIFATFGKTGGTTETAGQRWKIGTAGLATDAALIGPTAAVSAGNASSGYFLELKRVSPTQLNKLGNTNIAGSYNGPSTNGLAGPVTVLNMDAADFFISFTNTAAGTADTYTLLDYSVELITGV